MKIQHFLTKRARRYIAQVLNEYDREIAPHLSDDLNVQLASEAFKTRVRSAFNHLATDAGDCAEEIEINELAQEARDKLGIRRQPTGAPTA